MSWPLPENLSDEALERVVYRFAAVRTCFEFLGLFRWRIRKMIANQGQSILLGNSARTEQQAI